MKFRFRFASLLKVRRHKEQIEQQKMTMLLRERTRIAEEIEIEQEKVLSVFTYKTGRSESISSIRLGYDFMHDRKKRIIELQAELADIKLKIENQQAELSKARKKVKMIELIEEKDHNEFVKEQQAREQIQLNEVAMQMFNRTN